MSGSISLGLSRDVAGGDPNFALDVGSVLSRTFSVWAANLVPFCLVGLVVNSPVLLGLSAIGLSGSPAPGVQTLLGLLSNLLTLILTGGITYGVFQELRGERAGAGEILKLGLSRLLTVWATGILTGLGTALGCCALIVPGLILLSMWWVSVPVAVIEEPGAIGAMSRSSELTAGNRWQVFALALIFAVMVIMVSVVFNVIVVAAGAAAGAAPGAGLPAWGQLVLDVVLIPVQALAASAPAIAYHDLRVGKEGADVEELLKVFE
jgi:hypothetical protein